MKGLVPGDPTLAPGTVFVWEAKFYVVLSSEPYGDVAQLLEFEDATGDQIDRAIMTSTLYRIVVNRDEQERIVTSDIITGETS